ncbi:MAG: hypothetical protein NT004_11350, partial [Bacteroidetes bacterium]|nr:hypothetical protein [Bacteroidota bacterium]
MRNPSLEPLLITAVTGIFLLTFLLIRNQVFTAHPAVIQVRQKSQSKQIILPNPAESSGDSLKKAEPDSGVGANTYIGMEPFFESLQQISADNTTLHIAYFGDSMIEGDLVTHPLRRRLQKRFGGNGIGFIPVTSPQPGFRTTIIHHFNDEWKVYSFMKSGNSAGVKYSPEISAARSGMLIINTGIPGDDSFTWLITLRMACSY